MHVNLTAADVESYLRARYSGNSLPLIRNTSVGNIDDVASWLDSPRCERPETDNDAARRFAALQSYLYVGTHAGLEDAFPARFDFIDGQRRYPDKGVVKALYVAGIIQDRATSELCFVITERGQNWLND
jgi:hypothetical protein